MKKIKKLSLFIVTLAILAVSLCGCSSVDKKDLSFDDYKQTIEKVVIDNGYKVKFDKDKNDNVIANIMLYDNNFLMVTLQSATVTDTETGFQILKQKDNIANYFKIRLYATEGDGKEDIKGKNYPIDSKYYDFCIEMANAISGKQFTMKELETALNSTTGINAGQTTFGLMNDWKIGFSVYNVNTNAKGDHEALDIEGPTKSITVKSITENSSEISTTGYVILSILGVVVLAIILWIVCLYVQCHNQKKKINELFNEIRENK